MITSLPKICLHQSYYLKNYIAVLIVLDDEYHALLNAKEPNLL